jgi:glycosyltransferase involved in cell wall biosynthesis
MTCNALDNGSPLRILQVSSADQLGGAEKVAYDLFKSYEARGHVAHLAVGRKTLNDPNVLALNHTAARPAWARYWRARQLALCQQKIHVAPVLAGWLADAAEPRAAWGRWQGLENFDFPASSQLLGLPPQRPELLHLHNLHGEYFDLRVLPELSRQLPTILTLHDEWLFTGHCAYTFGSDRWKHGCQQCPDLAIYPPLKRDTTAQNWQRKKAILARSRVYVAAPSRWLLDEVAESILQPAVIEARLIPNGIDLGVFKPGAQAAARQALGLPHDADIALFVGSSTRSNHFKDYATIERAMELLAARPRARELVMVCLGEAAEHVRRGAVTLWFAGFEKDAARVALYYQAADVYLHAARAEAFGCTIAEAMACQTPVLATAVGGIPELIRDGETGWLVPAGDAAAIAERLPQLLADRAQLRVVGERASVYARAHFDLERQVTQYLDWYQEILGAIRRRVTRAALPSARRHKGGGS